MRVQRIIPSELAMVGSVMLVCLNGFVYLFYSLYVSFGIMMLCLCMYYS